MVEKFAYKNVRVIGRKRCLHCGNPIQVEAYNVEQALKMLLEYKDCGHPSCDGHKPSKFTKPQVEIVAIKK